MHISQQLAASAVDEVLAGHNLAASLEALFKRHSSITPQQRAVAQDLSYGTVRFYGRLHALLGQLLEKPLPDKCVECLLLVALYQLCYDQAAAHTVVDQAVQAAAQLKKPWAKGLVNGLLRNYLRSSERLNVALAANEVAAYCYPQWWINKLKQQYPAQWQAILVAGNGHPPMTLRVNQARMSRDDYANKLAEQGLLASALGATALKLAKPVSVDKIPGFQAGEVSVQDYGAQFAAPLLHVTAQQRLLDACCAPGGKTGHILELAEAQQLANLQLVALDSDASRLQRVQNNLQRLNLSAQLLVGDAAHPDSWWDGVPFQGILADVPCTASGIVRRHVDIKWLRREVDIATFARQQKRILQALWQLLAKGGKLLYVTCSIFHEENQQQIDQFLQTHADATQLPCAIVSNDSLQSLQLDQSSGLNQLLERNQAQLTSGQLLPCEQHDGFYYALLQKN